MRTFWKDTYVCCLFLTLVAIAAVNNSTGHAESDTSTSTQEFYFSGIESTATESFTVEDGWEVHGKTEGASFQLLAFGIVAPLYEGSMTETEQIRRSFEVYQPIILADSSKPSGTAFHRRGRTFYLHVITSGPWNIHIITVKTTKDYLDVPYTGAP